MSRIKTILTAAILLATFALPAVARENIAFTFAECAGRFSAELEHAWLLNDPMADAYQAERAAFVVLTTASMPTDAGRDVLNHRIEVKLAHAALLQRATFANHQTTQVAARNAASRHLAQCRSLLLGS